VLYKELRDGLDIHSDNQAKFGLPDRITAKIFKFKLLYGASEYGFAQDPSITSGDHISAILYGGIIEEVIKIPAGYYKSGTRKGEVKYANHVIQHTFERLVNPLKDTLTANSKKKEDAKQIWSVGEDVLKQLKGSAKAKEIISIILEHRRIYKAVSTYLVGYGDLIKEMGWENNVLHPNFNQCIVKTSRLSSSKP